MFYPRKKFQIFSSGLKEIVIHWDSLIWKNLSRRLGRKRINKDSVLILCYELRIIFRSQDFSLQCRIVIPVYVERCTVIM